MVSDLPLVRGLARLSGKRLLDSHGLESLRVHVHVCVHGLCFGFRVLVL